MTITITAADIEQGNKNCAYSCPASLALRRQTGTCWAVARRCAYAEGGGEFVPPPELRAWIDAFDTGLPVEPTTFEVELPEPQADDGAT